jgi:glycosyltransferase involved in cell wall biosynthesis
MRLSGIIKKERGIMGKISLVLPVYNEQLVIREVLKKYIDDLENTRKTLDYAWEIIAVDDGSSDETHLIMLRFAKEFRNFKVVTLNGRYGKHAAVTAGFAVATGDAVLVADIDLLNPAGIFTKIVKEWKDTKAPIIHGYREFIAGEKRKAVMDDFSVRLATKLFLIDGYYNGRVNIALYNDDVADVIRLNPTKNKYMRAMDNWVGWESKEIWFASEYSRDEIIEKTEKLKRRHGRIILPRDRGRENSPSKIYGFLFAFFAIVALAFAAVTIPWNVEMYTIGMFLIGAVLTLLSLLFFLRSVLLKRIGVINYAAGEIIYEIKSILNK